MSAEENKVLVRLFFRELYERGNLGVIDDMVADDVEEHEEFGGLAPAGKEGIKEAYSMLKSAFPDLSMSIDDESAEGDKVFLRTTWNGTHQGEFMGIPPTGMHVNFGSMDEIIIRDGKLKEHWGITDTMGLMLQLGAIEFPG